MTNEEYVLIVEADRIIRTYGEGTLASSFAEKVKAHFQPQQSNKGSKFELEPKVSFEWSQK